MKRVTNRAKTFGTLIAAGNAPTEALYKAGYKPSTDASARSMASKIQKDETIAALIEKERIKLFPEIEQCIKTLLELRDYCADPAIRIRACVELMERAGWSKDRTKVTFTQKHTVNLPERGGETEECIEVNEVNNV